jgi:hypothetical protein
VTATPAPSFLTRLRDYALGQLAANAPVLINAGLALTNGVINRLPIPPQGKGLVKGVVAAIATVATRSAVTPADPSKSAVQQFVQRTMGR